MKTVYSLYIDGLISGNLTSLLEAAGAERSAKPGGSHQWYVHNKPLRAQIKQELERRSINFTPIYEFTPEPSDDLSELAAYLGIKTLDLDAPPPPSPVLAKDPNDFRIIANNAMLELLGPITRGIQWKPYGPLPEFSFISSATELPDPVTIPGALDLQQIDNGTWDVSNDGRSIITKRNLERLNETGTSYSTNYSVEGHIYPRKKFPVFSGNVAQIAAQTCVNLVIYLTPEGFDVDPW